jgi:hypothetical protein
MKWTAPSYKARMIPLEKWHRWFAWHPVLCFDSDDDSVCHTVWLEEVERRCELWGDGEGPAVFEYRLPKKEGV